MSSSELKVSIIIPAYNEQENIKDLIQMIVCGLAESSIDYEIIIVDDGSKDRSSDIIRSMSAYRENIRLVSHAENLGKGAALRSGISNAGKEWILFTDADLQIDVAQLKAFLPYMDAYDLIAGYRTGRKESLLRRIGSRVYNAVVTGLLGIPVRDVGCPFKLVRAATIRKLDLISNGFLIDAEILYLLERQGCRIREIAVACQPRQKGISKVRLRHIVEIAGELMTVLSRTSRKAGRIGDSAE